MTAHRPLAALAAGALASGALLVAATPAVAQEACYPAQAACVVAPAGVDVATSYDAAANTVTLTIRGLRPGSAVTVNVTLPSGVSPATYSFDAETGALSGTATAAASGAITVSGTADAQGVARLAVPLAALGQLTPAQVGALNFSVAATAADGTPVSSDTGVGAPGATGGSDGTDGGAGGTSDVVSGSTLPFTGGEVLPVALAGAVLVLGGGGLVVVSRRRKVSAPVA